MTCVDVDRFLSEGVSTRELRSRRALQSHVQSCERCNELISWAEAPVPDLGHSDPVEQRIRAIIHADLKPVRPLPSNWGAAVAALLLAVVISAMHAMMMGVTGWAALSWLQIAVFYTFSAAVILLAAVSLLASIRPASRQWIPPLLPVVTLVVGFPLLIGGLFPPGSRHHFVSHGMRCLAGGLMIIALAGGITYWLARRGYSTNWSRTGALVGVVGGVVAVAALQVSCPDQEFGHLVVWHGLVILTAIVSGYLAGRRMDGV